MSSRWQLRYPSPDLARHYRESGWWTDDTLADIAAHGVKDASAVMCRVRSRIRPFVGTIGGVGDMGRRLAGALVRQGIVAGDVVAFQLPNWAEAVACFYGLLPLGVVLIPIVHIYGSKEVGHILRQSGARVLITTDHFARQDYVEQAWRIVDPVLQAMPPVIEYEPGTWGPREAAVLVAPDAWHDPVVRAAAQPGDAEEAAS